MAADTVSTLRLPSELTDRILDFLHDDRHALASCALTCHNWLPTARLHLFRTLSKIPLQDVVPLEQLLEEDPPLGSYIDRLELGRPDNFRAGRLFAKPPLLHLGILERCRMPNLRKLILCEVAVESFAPLVRCLFSQPALEELAIRATLFCEDYENLRSANVNKPKSVHIVVPMDTAAPLALRSLEIVTLTWRFPHTILPDTLIAMHRYLDLKEIVLDVPTKGLRHWAQALQILSGTITNLKLTVQDTDENLRTAFMLDAVRHCASLHFLTILIRSFASPRPESSEAPNRFGLIPALTDLLSQSMSPPALPQLKRLTLDIYATSLIQVIVRCMGAWRELARALRERRAVLRMHLHSEVPEADVSDGALAQLRELIKAFGRHGVEAELSYRPRVSQ